MNMSNKINLRTHLILFPIYILPYFCKKFLAYVLALIWFYIVPHRKKIMKNNLKKAFPKLNKKEKNSILFYSFYNLALTSLEYSYFPYISIERLRSMTEIHGLENLDNAFKKNKGVLLLGTHTGNGDLAVYRSCMEGYPFNLISRKVKNPFLNQAWFAIREKSGLKHLEPKKSSIKIVRLLKANKLVVFVLDQFTYPPVGIRSPLFGYDTGTNSSLAYFALRFDAPVIPAYSYRQKGKLHFVFDKEIETDVLSDNMELNIKHMTDKYNKCIEEIIRKHPREWMWIHRRWKKMDKFK